MVDPSTGTGAEGGGEAYQGPIVRDRRRIDPETGRVRQAYADAGGSFLAQGQAGTYSQDTYVPGEGSGGQQEQQLPSGREQGHEGSGGEYGSAEVQQALALAEERLADLQRLQAEYVNYRRRVERDRDVARDNAVAGVLESLLPVLDDIHLARQHGDLGGGPFAAIADKLEGILVRYGLSRYGAPGEPFDPTVHEALIHTQAELAEGTTEITVIQVLQPGYKAGDRVLRAARVAVAEPT